MRLNTIQYKTSSAYKFVALATAPEVSQSVRPVFLAVFGCNIKLQIYFQLYRLSYINCVLQP